MTSSTQILLSRRGASLIAAFAVGVAVYALSWCVVGFEWLMFDDDINVLVNPHLGRGWATVRWAFADFDYIRRYVPLGWLTFDSLLRIDGYNAVVFHVASVALHAGNAVLAFFAFREFIRPRPVDENTRAVGGALATGWAALAAFVWSVHPLRAENVGWISGLFYVASTTLALAAVLLVVREDGSGAQPRARARNAMAAAAFTVSLLVYPVYLALPAVLTLWLARREFSMRELRVAARRLWMWWFAAIAIGALNAIAALTTRGAFARTGTGLSVGDSLVGVAKAVALYAAHTFWPVNLCVYYGSSNAWLHLAAERWGAAIALIVGALLWARMASRRMATGLAVLLVISLAPFLTQFDASFTPSDRYAVLWLAVLCVALARWLAMLRTTKVRTAAMVLGAAMAIFLSVQYRAGLQVWRDTFSLQQAIDGRNATRPNPKLNFGRPALEFWWLGRGDEARARLEAGLRRFPLDPGLREDERAVRELDQRWRLRVGLRTDIPPLAVHHVDLGRQCMAEHAPAAALSHFKAALILAPHYADAAQAIDAATLTGR